MSPLLQELDIDKLSVEDRMSLAQQIWDSVAADLDQQPITPDQRAELERRIAKADATPGVGVLWELVRDEARARWQR